MSLANSNRLWFLDNIRVMAFGSLIFYHIGMFYWAGEPWHLKSTHQGDSIRYIMWFVNPWRIPLLFVISGVATKFMLDKLPAGVFVKKRSMQLLFPLLFGMFVVVVPQVYIQALDSNKTTLGFGAFWLQYLKAKTPAGYGITWNHLWFIAYLFVYTLIFVLFKKWLDRFETASLCKKIFSGWKGLVYPAIAIGVVWGLLRPFFPPRHDLVSDFANHGVYLICFSVGCVFAKEQTFWAWVEEWRWPALLVGLFVYYIWFILPVVMPIPTLFLRRVVTQFDVWAFIVASLGFGKKLAGSGSEIVRYLNKAIFCYYVLHQTFIIILGYYVKRLDMPVGLEFCFISVGTIFGIVIGYEVFRRIPIIRNLVGISG